VVAGTSRTPAGGTIEQPLIEIHGPTVKWKDVVALLRGSQHEVADIRLDEMQGGLRRPTAQEPGTAGLVSTPITIALIGCGAVSELFYSHALDTLAREGLAQTVALVDPDSGGRSRLAALLPTARQYPDVESLLKDTTPDLAIVAAPHTLHADLSIACLSHGVHVLCEKPMALTTSDCDRMIRAADEAGLLLAVGHFRRFYPSCEIIKTILDAGVLGPVKSFDFAEGYHYSWPARTASFFRRDEAGGGVFVDLGSHAIDLILWWLGDVRELSYEDDAMGGIEATCQLRLRTIKGAEGSLRLSRDLPLANSCLIHCEKGWVEYKCDVPDRIQWGLYESSYRLNTELRMPTAAEEARSPDTDGGVSSSLHAYFTAQVRNVVAAIGRREPVLVSGVEARRTIAVVEACYGNRRLLAMPWLDQAEMLRAQAMAHAG
jgi:predicted dehydrogenase